MSLLIELYDLKGFALGCKDCDSNIFGAKNLIMMMKFYYHFIILKLANPYAPNKSRAASHQAFHALKIGAGLFKPC
jgi:hypothetical protein